MKKNLLLAILILTWIGNSFAQSTTIALPTSDNTSSFNVTNSSSTNLFYVGGTGNVGIKQTSPHAELEIGGTNGLLVTGAYNSGAVSMLGAGMRLHWYPRKGAFRVGLAETTYWDDSNIGMYSVAMGYYTRATGAASVAIGAFNYSTAGYALTLGVNCQATAIRSIAIGSNSISSGYNSIALGTNIDLNGKYGSVVISDYYEDGYSVTASDDCQMTMRFYNGYRLFTSEICASGVTMSHGGSSWSTISDSTKKENLIKVDGEYFLNSLSKLRLGSWNYKKQDPKQFRHYGPMAQEIFNYFGKDEFGTVGNDTTLASADMDGIMMICLQALEKRTEELIMENGRWKMENVILKKENEEMKNEIAGLLNTLQEQDSKISTQQNTIREIADKLATIESKLNMNENNEIKLSCNNISPTKDGEEK